jgi:S-DNA-T family DNA segregation ATPase FtsK/SpoIIIE
VNNHPNGQGSTPRATIPGVLPAPARISWKEANPMPTVRVFPFSIFDPIHLGIDEHGENVYVNLAERNMLLGGEPGAGKSSGLNLITAHGALSHDCKLILVDGKQVELGLWRACADMFIGPSLKDAIAAFEQFQGTMNDRYKTLLATGRRKITRESGEDVYLIPIDEYAYFSATVGSKQDREKFAALTRDLVARGRAAGIIIILATQRPSHQVIDPSMRDLFSYRWAFRCTTDSSSDVVLGQGWASEGYTAADIDPLARGVGWLLSESGVPRRIKAAYLTDDDIKYLAAYAASLRGVGQAA